MIDAHTHFYDPTRPQGVPWPRPDHALLYRPVLPDAWAALAGPCGLTGAVVVEASPWFEDNAWVLALCRAFPMLLGLVGHVDPLEPSFPERIEALASDPWFKGVRIGGATVDKLLASGADRLAALEAADLSLDVLASPEHLASVARLAARRPGLRIVVNHVGGVTIDGQPPQAVWLAGMDELAHVPNVWIKLSGMPENTRQSPAPSDAAYYRPIFDALWRRFGADRLVFGSNWPVCDVAAPLDVVCRLTADLLAQASDDERLRVMSDNAMTVYRLDLPEP